jgi:hypothetical protein
VHRAFRREILREIYYLEDLGVDERLILKCTLNKYFGVVGWINLAHDRDKWLDLMKTIMSFRVPPNSGNFLTS